MSNSTIQCFRLYVTDMWPSEANRLTVRLCTQQDAQKRAASKCSGSSTQSSGTTSFILKLGVSWSQDGCRSSGHHKPSESHQVQSRTHKFSGDFPSFNLATKSFHAASGPSPLTSPWPEQCLLLNWALAKSNGIAMDGSPNHPSSLWNASSHQWPAYQLAQMMKLFYFNFDVLPKMFYLKRKTTTTITTFLRNKYHC